VAEDLIGGRVEGELPEEKDAGELAQMSFRESCRESCRERPTWRTTARELPGGLPESWRKRASERELAQESFRERPSARELLGES